MSEGQRLSMLGSLLCAAAAGCMSSDDLSLPEGLDLLIVALATDGTLEVNALRRGESLRAGWTGEDPIFFGYSAAEFLRPGGEPVERSDLAALQVRTLELSAPPMSCDRCRAPPFRPPQLVYPGDSCSLPRFGRVFVRQSSELVEVSSAPPEATEALRERIRMDWAGDCPFEEVPAPPGLIELRVLHPEVDPWPVERVAQAPDGTLGLFAERLALFIGGDGARTQREPPFEGPIEFAVGLEGGEFIVASRIPPGATGPKLRFDRFASPSFEPVALLSSSEFRDLPRGLVRVDSARARLLGAPAGLEALLIAGGRNPWVSVCVLDGILSCESLLDVRNRPPWTLESGRVAGVDALEDGTVVMIGEGRLAYGSRLDSDWSWRSSRPAVRGLETLASIGQQVFVCADDDQSGLEVLTATLTREMVRPEAREVDWIRRFERPSGSCGDFSQVPGARRLRLTLGAVTRRYVELDADDLSRPLEPLDLSELGIDREVRLRSLAPNLLVAQDLTGAVLRVGTGDEAELAYGTPELQGFAGALVPSEGEVLGFANQPSEAFTVTKLATGEWQVTGRRKIDDSFDVWKDLVTRGAVDSSDGSLWLTGYTLTATTVRGWLRHRRDGAWSEAVAAFGVRGLDLAEVAPGRFVVVADDWGIWVLESGALTPVEVIWDDPETPEIEGRPAPVAECGDGRSRFPKSIHESSSKTWRAVDAGEGAAWAVGCGGVVARVMPYGPAPFAERVGVGRLVKGAIEGDREDPPLSAVRVLSPERVLIAAAGLSRGTSEQGRLWEVRPNGSRLELVASTQHRPPVPALEVASGPPFAIVGPPDAAALIGSWGTDGSVQFVGSPDRARFPAALTAAASHGRDLIIGAWGNRVLVVSPRD